MHSRKSQRNVSKVHESVEHVSRKSSPKSNFSWTYIFFVSVSIISRAIIIYLIFIETTFYMDSKLIFKFKPDTDMDTKLKIHIDMTVATPCSSEWMKFRSKWIYSIIIFSALIFRCWRRYFGFNEPKCFLIRYFRRARYVVGTMPTAESILWIYTTFEWLFTRRISFVDGNQIIIHSSLG